MTEIHEHIIPLPIDLLFHFHDLLSSVEEAGF